MHPATSVKRSRQTICRYPCLLIITGSIGSAGVAAESSIFVTRSQDRLIVFNTVHYVFFICRRDIVTEWKRVYFMP
jgi:hypothetical protein